MTQRILTFGALAVIFVAALLAILLLLDIVTVDDARVSLGRTLAVIVVATTALVLMLAVVRLGRRP